MRQATGIWMMPSPIRRLAGLVNPLPTRHSHSYGPDMGSYVESTAEVMFPSRYRDAKGDLRLRIYDPTEDDIPDWVASVEVGDHLRAMVSWHICVVPSSMLGIWKVSLDEIVATATRNVAALPAQRHTLNRGDCRVEVIVGHLWASSLITCVGDDLKGHEGAIVAVPRADVMLSAPVIGQPTVDSLEMMMLLCDALYDRDDSGVSPHVWWAWNDGLYRVTDRFEDGEVDIQPPRNVSAHYLLGALRHLINPCEECGRDGPAEGAVPSDVK